MSGLEEALEYFNEGEELLGLHSTHVLAGVVVEAYEVLQAEIIRKNTALDYILDTCLRGTTSLTNFEAIEDAARAALAPALEDKGAR